MLPRNAQGLALPLHYEGEPSGAVVRIRFPAPEGESFGPFRVPAGLGRLRASGERSFAPGAVLVESGLSKGERRVVDLR